MNRKRVLVLCTGISRRSQIAEGWINHLLGERFKARSLSTKLLEWLVIG
ncbi:MAG: hypothetical protein JXO72_14015 [Vicinamibacteria bacterium]|nr:hypothetical protein [Vicinamibacteria bacterium]